MGRGAQEPNIDTVTSYILVWKQDYRMGQ